MSNIHQLKRRISTAQNISKITKAMEMVAASKMKKAQDQALASRPYAESLFNSLKMLAGKTDSSLHPLLSHHETGKDVALIISTDKGLCGSLNTNLFKALSHWKQLQEQPIVIAIGKKAVKYARTYGYELEAQFTEIPDQVSVNDLLPISTLIIDGFLKKEFRSVTLIYTDFINTLTQTTAVAKLLPLETPSSHADDPTDIEPMEAAYVFEPSPKVILDELLPYYVENAIYQSLLEAKASEQSARMVAMKNASENANELMSELELMFNKTRQESITNELLEITTATLTLS